MVWIAGVILVLCILSVGPACRLERNGTLNESVYLGIYAPLEIAYDSSALCRGFFDWYVHLWGVRIAAD